MKEKRGISPVIATVLLIGMVIVVALIIFLWVRELGGEAITKFDGKNIETVCGEVEFNGDYYNGKISISNDGPVPIFNFKVKFVEGGSYNTSNAWDLGGDWPTYGLKQGEVFVSGNVAARASDAEKIVIIPVLMGTSSKGERSYMCKEETYGQEIYLE